MKSIHAKLGGMILLQNYLYAFFLKQGYWTILPVTDVTFDQSETKSYRNRTGNL